jgi:hypothetical protein
MKHPIGLLFGLVFVALGLFAASIVFINGVVGAEPPDAQQPANKLPPLVVDKDDARLLLDEPDDTAKKQTGADNSHCFVCHNNYHDEPLVTIHSRDEVGCVDCHGESAEHADDEDHVTPPDVMYLKEQIDAACGDCHDSHDAPARQVLARWQGRCPSQKDFSKIACTDCHGRHKLEKRTVEWDKKTRKMIVREPGGEEGLRHVSPVGGNKS